MPDSGILPPAFTPAKTVPVPFTKLNDPSPKNPTHSTSLFEATSIPTCSQFADSLTKSPNLTANLTPFSAAGHAAESFCTPLSSLGSSLGGVEVQFDHRRYSFQLLSWFSRWM